MQRPADPWEGVRGGGFSLKFPVFVKASLIKRRLLLRSSAGQSRLLEKLRLTRVAYKHSFEMGVV